MKSITRHISNRPAALRAVSSAIFTLFTAIFLNFNVLAQPIWQSADQQTAAASANNTITCNAPSNLSSGDLIIFIVATQNSPDDGSSGFTTPAGFTSIRYEQDSGNDNRPEVAAFYKISDGTETTITCTVSTNNGNDPDWKAVAGRVTNFNAAAPIEVHSGDNSGSSSVSTITAPSVTTTFDNSLLIAARNIRHNISDDNPPAGMTVISAQNGDSGGGSSTHDPALHVAQETLGAAGATGTRTFNWSSSTQRAAVLMFTITEVQCSPEIGDPAFTLGANSTRCTGAGSVTYDATSSNATGLSYALDGDALAAGVTINGANGQVTYPGGWQDTATITVTATGCGGPKTANHIAITKGDVATPAFIIGSTSGRCIDNEARVYGAFAENSDSVRYSLDATSQSAGATIIEKIGSVTFPATYTGNSVITVTAYGCGGPKTATHTVSTGVQSLVQDSAYTGQYQVVTVDVLRNDRCDIDTNTLSVLVAPTRGTATVNTTTGQITYTPNGTYTGLDSLTYRVCGIVNPTQCSTEKVYINVSPEFSDDYFNQPTSNCYKTLDSIPVFDIAQKYLTADNAASYCNPMIADLDGNGTIEIVQVASDNLQTSSPRSSKNLRVYDGNSGATLYTITCPYIGYDGSTPVAMGDVDDDGDIEIFVASLHSRNADPADDLHLFCYDHLGTLLWRSNVTYGANTPGNGSGGSVGLADFNEDGIPEVYVYNEIFNALTGVKLCDGGSNGIGMYSTHLTVDQSVVAAANLTSSDGLELAAGRTVYEVTITNTAGTVGNSMTAINYSGGSTSAWDGYTGLADFDLDGELDVVVVANNKTIYVWNPRTNTTMASRTTTSGTLLGPLFIGDVDGTGVPNIGFCRQNSVEMYEYDGTTTLGIKWSLATSDGSGETGITMFDFDQNGTQEIVYRDETDLRIINGAGAVPFDEVTIPATSGTGNEGPVVADVDNDGQAEIIVTTEGTGGINRIAQVAVFESVDYAWAPARKVWNQFAYFNTHINDDYTIPQYQPDHGNQYFTNPSGCPIVFQSRPLNSFNVQSTIYADNGCPVSYLPDAEVLVDGIFFDEAVNEVTITFSALNRSNGAALPSAIDIAFYVGNPLDSAATLKATTKTAQIIEPVSQIDDMTIVLTGVNANDWIYVVINDDGLTPGPITLPTTDLEECYYENNPVGFLLSSESVLGVDLVSFEAQRVNDEILVNWQTSSETNNDFFMVQKSTDGLHFDNLQRVRGAGNKTTASYYEIIDENPSEGMNYYRLFQQDFNGEYAYSDVVGVFYSDKEFALYPNPTEGLFEIANPFGECDIQVMNATGQVVHQQTISEGSNQLNFNHLPAGYYFIQFGGVKPMVKRLILR